MGRISEIWELETDGEADLATLSAWGFEDAEIVFGNQVPDVLTLRMSVEDAGAADDLWAWETPVTLYRDSVVFFRGWVDGSPRRSEPGADGQSYEVKSAFWLLDRTPYLQDWKSWNGTDLDTVSSPRILLGWNTGSGTPETSKESLTKLAAFATAAGVPITIDSTDLPDLEIPVIAAANRMIGDLIREVLRWHPDAVLRATFTAAGTSFKVVRRSTAATVSLGTSAAPSAGYEVRPRPDLVPDAVVVIYEAQAPQVALVTDEDAPAGSPQISTSRRLVLARDVYPLGATITRKTMVVTIPAGGLSNATTAPAEVKTHKQPIRTRALPETGATDAEAETWWLDHSGLAGLGLVADDIVLPTGTTSTVQAHKLTIVEDELPQPPSAINPNSTPVYRAPAVTDLPRELIGGQVTDWMGVLATPVLAEVTIGISKAAVDALAEKPKSVILGMGPTEATIGGVDAYLLDCSCRVMGTDAATKVYQRAVSVNLAGLESEEAIAAANVAAVNALLAEVVVPGLARRLYDARSATPYEGNFPLIEEESGAVRYLGKVLGMTHATRTEWATMAAQIQGEKLAVGSGMTTLTFGPPKHLAPQDFAELFQVARTANAARAQASQFPQDQMGAIFPGGGFSYDETGSDESPVVGGSMGPIADFTWRTKGSASVRDGFTVYRVDADEIAVEAAVLSGFGASAKMPKLGGVRLDDATTPTITVSATLERWVALKLTVVPDSELGPDGATYQIKGDAGTISGDVSVEVYTSTTAMDAAEVLPVINTSTGAVTTNGTYVIYLGKQGADGALSQTGYIGPLGVRMCASGAITVESPARVLRG